MVFDKEVKCVRKGAGTYREFESPCQRVGISPSVARVGDPLFVADPLQDSSLAAVSVVTSCWTRLTNKALPGIRLTRPRPSLSLQLLLERAAQ